MSSLRRDLIERRLWPLVALLLVAVAAVPLVVQRTGARGAQVTVPPVPHGAPAGPVPPPTAAYATVRTPGQAVQLARRDPFTSPLAKPKPAPSPVSTPSASAASTPSGATSTPAPAASTASAASGSTGNTQTSSNSSSGGSSSTTSPPASTPTAAPVTPAPTSTGPWTLYSVDLRIGAEAPGALRSDIARLTPIPSVAHPAVMFMGVLAGGRQVVLALADGASPSGPGRCMPARAQCAAVVLRPGQTEQVTQWLPAGQRHVSVRVVHIAHRVTSSLQEALGAYRRHSAAGLCELALADPVAYDPIRGTLIEAGALCRKQPQAVPFPGLQGGL